MQPSFTACVSRAYFAHVQGTLEVFGFRSTLLFTIDDLGTDDTADLPSLLQPFTFTLVLDRLLNVLPCPSSGNVFPSITSLIYILFALFLIYIGKWY